ncbi:uncharacterized protein TA16480 [Theileria annulata]|uniref:Uncharacterized protein n=1 Tax=Theileria annulata TaxID=5874 RepID=Q4UIX1_THEAN|nr:uncharacterized protein TA16480 [Theileria annulata]CAI72968.1 hypothetical protein TA16480 [Theileria annulata]|eukprot:XP_953646.1 hypothetical protein TA16480 [Theileria annulata]
MNCLLFKLLNVCSTFPYLNVYYNFDPKDWSKIREQQSRLANFRKRLSRLRRQVVTDMDRISQFMDIEKNLAINARGKLFQTALSKNVLPIKTGNKLI